MMKISKTLFEMIFSLFVVFFLFSGSQAFGEDPTVGEIIKNLQSRFSEVDDYTVILSVKSDIKQVRIPDMNVKVYFKQPDKMHMESRSFAMLPREGMFLNPNQFNREDYYMSILGKDILKGNELYKLELMPRKDNSKIRRLILWVDPLKWVAVKVNTTAWQGQTFSIDFEYQEFKGKFWLPVKAVAIVDLAGFQGFSSFHHGSERLGDDTQKEPDEIKGMITLDFTEYKINEGISDSFFEEAGKPRWQQKR